MSAALLIEPLAVGAIPQEGQGVGKGTVLRRSANVVPRKSDLFLSYCKCAVLTVGWDEVLAEDEPEGWTDSLTARSQKRYLF